MRINEIFLSVSGECGAFPQGSWCVFVRLAGCNLRCKWCDTVRAQGPLSGNILSPREVLKQIEGLATEDLGRVLITGGEPLLDVADLPVLIDLLLIRGFTIQIETNGSVPIPDHLLTKRIAWVIDYKLPSSGMENQMLPINEFKKYTVKSLVWIKFVITDLLDYNRAKEVVGVMGIKPFLAFSAAKPLSHATLYQWMKRDRLVHIQQSVQIHKLARLIEG